MVLVVKYLGLDCVFHHPLVPNDHLIESNLDDI